jgi:hypothetical protein
MPIELMQRAIMLQAGAFFVEIEKACALDGEKTDAVPLR